MKNYILKKSTWWVYILIAVLAGCGGDSSDSGTSVAPVSPILADPSSLIDLGSSGSAATVNQANAQLIANSLSGTGSSHRLSSVVDGQKSPIISGHQLVDIVRDTLVIDATPYALNRVAHSRTSCTNSGGFRDVVVDFGGDATIVDNKAYPYQITYVNCRLFSNLDLYNGVLGGTITYVGPHAKELLLVFRTDTTFGGGLTYDRGGRVTVTYQVAGQYGRYIQRSNITGTFGSIRFGYRDDDTSIVIAADGSWTMSSSGRLYFGDTLSTYVTYDTSYSSKRNLAYSTAGSLTDGNARYEARVGAFIVTVAGGRITVTDDAGNRLFERPL